MNKCVSLPGIAKVWYIERDCLPEDVGYRAVAGIPVAFDGTPERVSLQGEGLCELEQSFDNNSYIEKVKLSFETFDEIPNEQHPAFVIETNNGEKYVIGAWERPYPTVKINHSTGHPDGDASVRKYEVSYTAKKALALCEA